MASSRTQISPKACSASLTEVPRPRHSDALPLDDGRPLGDGLPLYGGTANRGRIVRVGDTVVRPAAPFRAATHALLAHLEAAGFDGAPRVLAAGPVTETL